MGRFPLSVIVGIRPGQGDDKSGKHQYRAQGDTDDIEWDVPQEQKYGEDYPECSEDGYEIFPDLSALHLVCSIMIVICTGISYHNAVAALPMGVALYGIL